MKQVQQQEIHQFIERYFQANGCTIIENAPGYLTVQLTIELDKELMNRPFYWHYIEKIGGIPNPMQLTFITNQDKAPKDLMGEHIHFGSPRLHQIFASTKKLAGYVQQYEKLSKGTYNKQTPLKPWLGMNIRISYQCDRKRDVFKSIGLQLINGQMVNSFHEKLLSLELTRKIPDYSFTLSPLIMPKSGIRRIENYIQEQIEQEDHTWAEDARIRWDKDLQLLEHFYEEVEEKGEVYATEKLALKEQYEPKICISVVNGGVFYLTDQAI